jgi:hypothetical protein
MSTPMEFQTTLLISGSGFHRISAVCAAITVSNVVLRTKESRSNLIVEIYTRIVSGQSLSSFN